MTWAVWRVTYATYADMSAQGDIKPVLIARGLTLDAAKVLAQGLGFGHSAHLEY